jgi:hypothetical protein
VRDWIQERAAKIKAEERVRQRERDWQAQQAEVIKANAAAILDRLFKTVVSDIRKFNALFPDDPHRRIQRAERTTSGGFLVHQTHYPAVTLEVSLNSEQLEYVYTKTPNAQTLPFQIKGNFSLGLTESGAIYIHQDSNPLSLEQVSRILLEPIFS